MARRPAGLRGPLRTLALTALALGAFGCAGEITSCGLWRSEGGQALEILTGTDRTAALGGARRTFARPVPLPESDVPLEFDGGAVPCADYRVDLSFDGRRARVRTDEGALAYVDFDAGRALGPDDVAGETRAALFGAPERLTPRQEIEGRPVRWYPTRRMPGSEDLR